MGYEFQVTVDSNSPHTQAKWWAEALGWRVEPSDENFIRGLIAAGQAREDDTEIFEGKLVWRIGAAISDPETPARPRVLFQLVPEGKTVIRYESPEVFETLTKEWCVAKSSRRSRTRIDAE